MEQKTTLSWIEDYSIGLEIAGKEKKPMLLDFFKDG